MTKPWRNITTIWSDKKNCVFIFISVNLTGDSTKRDNLHVVVAFLTDTALTNFEYHQSGIPFLFLGGNFSIAI